MIRQWDGEAEEIVQAFGVPMMTVKRYKRFTGVRVTHADETSSPEVYVPGVVV